MSQPDDDAALLRTCAAIGESRRLHRPCIPQTLFPSHQAFVSIGPKPLDMAQWWPPTVAGYLELVSKTLICEAVTEAKGKAAADNIAALKKGDMANRAAELLAGTGWLPAMLRAA